MSKTIDSTLVLPRLAEVQPARAVEVSDWVDLNQALNYHYARTGVVVGGMTFRPPWETNSTSYTTANNSGTDPGGQYDLDDWQGLLRFQRPVYTSATGNNRFQLRVNAYLQNLDFRVLMYGLGSQSGDPPTVDTSGSLGGTNLVLSSSSGDSEWVTDTIDIGTSNTDWRLLIVEARVPDSGTGYLWEFNMRAYIDDADELPRGL